MTGQNPMLGDGSGMVTLASIGAAYSLAHAYIKAHTGSVEEDKKKSPTSSPSDVPGLPTVQESDEVPGPTASSVKPVMGPTMSTTPKPGGSRVTPASTKTSMGLFKSLQTILSIIKEPGVIEPQAKLPVFALSVSLTMTILSRTAGDLFLQRITSTIDDSILTQNRSSFSKLLTNFVVMGIPVALAQQLAHWSAANLSSKLRRSLISVLMERLVLSDHNLCHPEELVDQDRLEALMNDITTASTAGVQLASERLKRITEIFLSFRYLVKIVGFRAPLLMIAYLYITVRITTRQKLYKAIFHKRVAEKEHALKKFLSRLQRHRDDVALWKGASAEKESVSRLVQRIETTRSTRDGFEFLHSFSSVLSSRVGAAALGFGLIAPHFLNQNRPFAQYILTARVMIQFCTSVSSLLEEEFFMTLPKPPGVAPEETNPTVAAMVRLSASARRLRASLVELPKQLPSTETLPYRIRKSNLCLNDVTGMSPDGSVLFQSLSLELSPGGSMLVRGPKGSGKSALLRLMAGTWPAVMGEVSRPRAGVCCLPPKPYLLLEGSLRDQICYPDTGDSVEQESLQAAIKATNISHLFTVTGIGRSGSGSALMGETDQAKLMLARLIYHKPRYALLDDCWKNLDPEYFCGILKYLKNELNCGLVLATLDASTLLSPSFGFSFDLELALNNTKQPPRHEIIVHRPK